MPLIAYYPLQEDSGSTAYDVRGSNDGTINGATLGVQGINGNTAYEFNSSGTDDVTISDNSAFDIESGDAITVSFWMNSAYQGGSSAKRIIGKGDSSGGVFEVWDVIVYDDDGDGTYSDIRQSYQDGSDETYNFFTGDIIDGKWHLVTAVYIQGDEIKLFVDGALQDRSDASSINGWNNSTPVQIGDGNIGQSSNPPEPYDGSICEVRIYDHALTASEIQYLYDVARNGQYFSQSKDL